MNRFEEDIEIENKKHEKVIKLLRTLADEPELSFISSVSYAGMHGGTCDTLKEITERLHCMLKVFGKYTLEKYTGSFCKELLLHYRFEEYDFTVSFYCREMEYALNIVSRGKCKMVKSKSASYNVYNVVCDN